MRLQPIRKITSGYGAHHRLEPAAVNPLRRRVLLDAVIDQGPEPIHVEIQKAHRVPIDFHYNTHFSST